MSASASKSDRSHSSSPRRASTAAFAGTVLEYYDLVIYGSASALVFGDSFFGDVSPVVGLALSFATFASGFLARPFGAVLFGHIGDRRGRRAALMATITLMGVSTVLIGLLPTYATIGALAPILLVILRLGQGIAIGGELGGAILVSVESAPANRRGFFGSFSTAGGQAGTVLATVVFALVTLMPHEQFHAWGWRIPFIASAAIVIVGIVIRRSLTESPDFEKASDTPQVKRRSPIIIALTRYWHLIIALMLVQVGMISSWYFLSVYSLSYAVGTAHIDQTVFLWLIGAAALFVVVMNPVWGSLSDRFGRRRILAAGLAAEGILLALFVAALGTHNVVLISLALLAVGGLGHAVGNGIYPAFLVETLPPEVRYTAGSLAIQLAGVIGGLIPLIAVLLQSTPLGIWAVTLLCVGFCAVGVLCVLLVGRSRIVRAQAEATVRGEAAPSERTR